MREPHIEDLASHDGPESCAGNREEAGVEIPDPVDRFSGLSESWSFGRC
jgi:hypothetical protein